MKSIKARRGSRKYGKLRHKKKSWFHHDLSWWIINYGAVGTEMYKREKCWEFDI